MPRIADYSVIDDNVTFAGPNTDFEIQFGINNDAHLGSPGIFTARLHFQGPVNFRPKFFLNGERFFRFPFRADEENCFSVHEILNPGLLRRGTNTLTVTTGGSVGEVAISDMYVMFQRDI